jgi:hypothetical protein
MTWETANAYESVTAMVRECINSDEATVGAIIRANNQQFIVATIGESVAFYNSMLPTGKALSVQGVMNIASTFSEHPDLKHLRLSELKTFFSLAFKQQRFGKLFGGFGYDTLLDWFNQFNDQRMEQVIDYRENQHNQATTFEKQRRTRSEGDAFGSIGSVIKGGQQ